MTTSTALQFTRADGSPRRILYAEDQTTSRIVTKAMLERMGFSVDAVEDGELALNAARNDNYDVILLDIEMPVMDGVTAARSIRSELAHCQGTPILALSAFLADSTEHSQWRDAFDQALPKPANGNELLRAMKSAVALKDAKTMKLPAKPGREELASALRGSIPPGLWSRLGANAAKEMHHLANVVAAAFAAGDKDVSHHAILSLKGLALIFDVAAVSQAAQDMETAPNGARVTNLILEVDLWEKSLKP